MTTEMTIEPVSLRSRKHAEARRTLFETAMRLFREKGFEETSVDAIAEAAGFSRATFFNYFGTKAAVLRYYGEHLQERVSQALSTSDPEVPALDRIRNLLLVMAKDAEAHCDDLRVVFAHSIHDPAYMTSPTPARERIVKMLAHLIREAQSAGHARQDLSALEQSWQLLGLYNNAVLTIISGRRSARAAIGSMWNFAMGGICGRHTVARWYG
jgi:AcrR family transcriptional regulator